VVRARLRSAEPGRVTYLPWVDYQELPARIAAADCVLGIFGAGDKASRVVPNKVFQAMAMGAPVITRESPAIERVLTHRQSALLIPPADPDALAAAIHEMRDPALRAQLGRGAREAFLRTGSREALACSLEAALDGVRELGIAPLAKTTTTDRTP
jgi:glycosyltransferase involved in cell wall biosynthesis